MTEGNYSSNLRKLLKELKNDVYNILSRTYFLSLAYTFQNYYSTAFGRNVAHRNIKIKK